MTLNNNNKGVHISNYSTTAYANWPLNKSKESKIIS